MFSFIFGLDVIGFFLAYFLEEWFAWFCGRQSSLLTSSHCTTIYCIGTVFALMYFYILGHYGRRKPFFDEIRDIIKVLFFLFLIQGFIIYLISNLNFSLLWFVGTVTGSFAVILLFRFTLKKLLISMGKWQVPTVILGSGPSALSAAEALDSESSMGFDLKAFLTLPGEKYSTQIAKKKVPIIPIENNLILTLRKLGSPDVVLALEPDRIDRSLKLIEKLHRSFFNVSIATVMPGLPLVGLEVNHFFRREIALLHVKNNLAKPLPRLIKRLFDIVGSVLGLLFFSPLFIFLSLKIRQDGGKVFFGHKRIGRHGKVFICYKFRSMVPNAQKILLKILKDDSKARKEWNRNFKLKRDPRITPVGEFLRKTSLDELPQLWNVLIGDMSLIGPRPVVDKELDRYKENVHYYLEVKPGISGLWQISGRNDTNYANRVYLDAWYAKNWSLWYDIVILFKTMKVLLKKNGAY
jgi:undecaprenyl-phosphate galactose phosphotransferase